MKRKAFILTEILTGLLLQAGFALTLCGAFYMLVTFSSSISNAMSSDSQGQRVITFIENRIRNAGLGFKNCDSPTKIAEAFKISDSNMKLLNGLHLPVAIMSSTDNRGARVSYDERYYEGNVLHLLYTQKDSNANELLVLSTRVSTDVIELPAKSSDKFRFLFERREYSKKQSNSSAYNQSYFKLTDTINETNHSSKNLRRWAVTEASGMPVMVSEFAKPSTTSSRYEFKITAPEKYPVSIYPMSELLTLRFAKMYVTKDSGGDYVFAFQTASNDLDTFNGKYYYHAKDILEIHMKLDTKPNYDATLHVPQAPIFYLKVLLKTGEQPTDSEGNVIPSVCPDNWPSAYWRDEFAQYTVKVIEASWKLYNLTGFDFGTTLP